MLQSLNTMQLYLFNKRSKQSETVSVAWRSDEELNLFSLCLLDFTRHYENLHQVTPPLFFPSFIHEMKILIEDFTPGLHQAELLLYTKPPLQSISGEFFLFLFWFLSESQKKAFMCCMDDAVCFHHSAQISRTLFMPYNVTSLLIIVFSVCLMF